MIELIKIGDQIETDDYGDVTIRDIFISPTSGERVFLAEDDEGNKFVAHSEDMADNGPDGPAEHEKMAKLIKEYGPDFIKKLPLYKTAHYKGKCVGICEVDVKNMQALVKDRQGTHINCSVADLTDFVL